MSAEEGWENEVRKVRPYIAGEQPKDPSMIKLNTNECPYPPSPKVQEALENLAKDYGKLRLYPDMNVSMLVKALSQCYGVKEDQIFVGVGSDDVLALSFLTFFTSGARILFPDITYSFYDVWADLYRIPYTKVPLDEEFQIRPEDYLPGSPYFVQGEGRVGGIIFPNPNAPTGRVLSLSDVKKIVEANQDKVVIIDEAYIDFGAETALPLLQEYDNLLVVQTFSKSRAMAGMRIGFAMGNTKLIQALKDVKFSFNSYTLNLPSIVAGTAAVQDDGYFRLITGRVVETREEFKKTIRKLGFVGPDSMTNFVFVRYPGKSGEELFQALKERKILVRHWNKPRIEDYLRITIGKDEQMTAVEHVLEELVC